MDTGSFVKILEQHVRKALKAEEEYGESQQSLTVFRTTVLTNSTIITLVALLKRSKCMDAITLHWLNMEPTVIFLLFCWYEITTLIHSMSAVDMQHTVQKKQR